MGEIRVCHRVIHSSKDCSGCCSEQRHREHAGRALAVGPVPGCRPLVAPVVAVERLHHRVAGQTAWRPRPGPASKGARCSTVSTHSETSPCSGVSPSGVGTGAGMSLSGVPHVDAQAQRVERQQLLAHRAEQDVGGLGPGAGRVEPHQVHQLLHVGTSPSSPGQPERLAHRGLEVGIAQRAPELQHHCGVLSHLDPQRGGRVLQRVGHRDRHQLGTRPSLGPTRVLTVAPHWAWRSS